MRKALMFLLVLGVLAAAVFIFRKSATEANDEAKQPVARIETLVLKRQAIAQTLGAFGIVAAAPSSDQTIVAAFDCLVRRIIAVPGARVAAGDVLLEIAPTPDAKLQYDAARGALALASKLLAATQERYDLKLANNQELLAAQQAELDARQKTASLENRGLSADGRIVAPASGVVSKLDISAGALVPAGTALVIVTTEARLEARLGIEAAEVAQVTSGQTVTLVSANRPDAQPITSQVRVAGSSLDSVTGAAEIRVPVPAGAPLLLGEHVRAAIELRKKDALVVPHNAVLSEEGKAVLYTVKNDRAVRHEVITGISAGDLVEVNGGDLLEGDTVVTLGNYELTNGMAVQSKTTKAAANPDRGKGRDAKEAKP
jgi:RND family efflux transporter MFP subunit